MDPVQPIERPRIRPAYNPAAAPAAPYSHPLAKPKPTAPAKPAARTCLPPSEPVKEWRAPKLAPPPPPITATPANVTRVKRDLREPKQQGMEAYDVGQGMKSNPYPNGAPGHSEWRRGWAIACSRDCKPGAARSADAPASPAFTFGWQAAKRGEALSRNPYKDTGRYEEWVKGWKSAGKGDPSPVPPAPGGPKPKKKSDAPATPTSTAHAEVQAGARELRTIRETLKHANVADAYAGSLSFRIQSALATSPGPKFRVKGESLSGATFTGEAGGRHEFYAQVTLLLAPAFTAEMKGRFIFRGNGDQWMADVQPAFKALFAKWPNHVAETVPPEDV